MITKHFQTQNERTLDNINGNYFLLPNTIFDEGLTPMEFVVYSFFISRKDKHNQSYYSVAQAAEVLGISTVSLYKLIKKDNTFPVIEMGRRKVIPKEHLKNWIDSKISTN